MSMLSYNISEICFGLMFMGPCIINIC